MKKRITDSNKPIGKMTKISDFLPPPEKLVMPEETVKITLFLKEVECGFFQAQCEAISHEIPEDDP